MDLRKDIVKKREELGKKTTDFFFMFHTLNRGYHCCINKISQEIGLSKGQPPVLLFLEEEKSKTQKELADMLNVKPASMTDVLKRMEKNGLIERNRGENDLRTMHVTITEKGKDKSDEFLQKERDLETLFFKGFSDKEKESFLKLFAKMTDNIMSELDCTGVEE